MNHIGGIIKKYRQIANRTRKELAKNICSEKYLYLIEKGERTPSTNILRLFSIRLGYDLFEYYAYLDCKEPIQVYKAINQFYMYRRNSDFVALQKYTDMVQTLSDFQTEPWRYELEVNKISYMVLVEQQYQESIVYINDLIRTIEPQYLEEEFVVNLYVLLSTCYQATLDIENARNALSCERAIIENKLNTKKYYQAIISVKLNHITLCHITGEHDTAIKEGLWVQQFLTEKNLYEYSNYNRYYLAYSYYKKGMFQEAFEWFEKCIYSLLTTYDPISALHLSQYDLFDTFLKSNRILAGLDKKIKEKYNFIQ